MRKPEFVLENETHKIPCVFEIKMYPLVPTRKQNQEVINKEDIYIYIYIYIEERERERENAI